jgi:hypothetical protein
MAELLYAFQEDARIPGAAHLVTPRIEDLIANAQTARLPPVVDKSGSPLHFGERRLNSIEVVELHAGQRGVAAYRDLSGIAHARPTALIRRVQKSLTLNAPTTSLPRSRG